MTDQESNVKFTPEFTPVTKNSIGFGVIAVLVLAIFTVVVIGGIIAIQSF